MHWLVKGAEPKDSLFFHYSGNSFKMVCIPVVLAKFYPGHGGQTKDQDGGEDDGYDEVIYPVDFRTAGHIVDDEMHKIMFVAQLSPTRRNYLTPI